MTNLITFEDGDTAITHNCGIARPDTQMVDTRDIEELPEEVYAAIQAEPARFELVEDAEGKIVAIAPSGENAIETEATSIQSK